MKKTIITIVVIIIAVVVVYFISQSFSKPTVVENPDTNTGGVSGEPVVVSVVNKEMTVIGKSVEGRDIVAYHFGNINATSTTANDRDVLFVGGIHGGYEWNTALVAYQTMDYLKSNPSVIPNNVRVTVIPVLNPDGLSKVLATPFVPSFAGFKAADVSTSQDKQVAGRFNANTVDLNRNFDCDWQTEGKWQNKTVSGGSAAFSEPESLAMKNYVAMQSPDAVVVWYSAAGGVFASSCHNGVSTDTSSLTTTFAKASGYPAHESFDFYEITGDMVNWLAKEKIPAISVLLTNHTETEWTKNRAGVEAVLKKFAK